VAARKCYRNLTITARAFSRAEEPSFGFCIFTASAFASFGAAACVDDIPFGWILTWLTKNGVNLGVGFSHGIPVATLCSMRSTLSLHLIHSTVSGHDHGEEFRALHGVVH
jgi:hypothetical protein